MMEVTDPSILAHFGSPISSAILGQESGNNANIGKSIDGAIGMGQIMPGTFAQYAQPGEDINNPADNLAVHRRIIDDLSKKSGGDPARIAVGYFSGAGNIAPSGSAIPYKADHKDGNGKSVSSYVSDVMKRIGTQYADSGNIATDAQTDMQEVTDPAILAKFADQNPSKTIGGAFDKLMKRVNEGPIGQTFQGAVNSAADVEGNIYGALTGNNYKEQTPTPDLDALKQAAGVTNKQDFLSRLKSAYDNTTMPQKFGAAEEALFNSPTGKVLGMGAGTPAGLPLAAGISELNQAGEKIGIPHQYSTALEMALPFLMGKKAQPKAPLEGEILPPEQTPPPAGVPLLERPAIDNQQAEARQVPPDNANPSPVPPTQKPLPVGLNKTDTGKDILFSKKAAENAQNILKTALEEEGIKPEDVAANLESGQTTGLPLNALDLAQKNVGGVQVQGTGLLKLGRAVANMPGLGAVMAGDTAARGYNSSQRIGEAFDKSISNAPYYGVKGDAIQQQEGSGKLYKEAFSANKSMSSPEINLILNTPAGKKALNAAATTMQNDRSLVGISNPDLVEQASLAGQEIPKGGIADGLKLRTLHYVKQELWNLAQQERDSKTFKYTPNGNAILGQYHDLLNEINSNDATREPNKKNSGLYAQANQTYATPARVKTALEDGRGFMAQDPEEIAQFFNNKNVSNPEKAAFAAGARRALQDKIDNMRDTANPITSLWKPALRKRLEPMFPDKKAFDQFTQHMEHEMTMHRTNGAFTGNSATEANRQFSDMVKQQSPLGKIIKGVIDPTGTAASMGIEALSGEMQKATAKMSKDTAAVIMRYLTSKDPEVWHDLADRINNPKNGFFYKEPNLSKRKKS